LTHNSSIEFCIHCLNCRADGPIKPTAEEALDAWNQAGLTQEKVIAEAVTAEVARVTS